MAIPALRPPKFLGEAEETKKVDKMKSEPHVILSLRNGTKLVIPSDSHNGIIKMEDMYKCVFCELDMEPEAVYKEFHVNSNSHVRTMNSFRYVENLADHLMKQLNSDQIYCIICNAIVSAHMVTRHIASEVHSSELQRAKLKISAYEAK